MVTFRLQHTGETHDVLCICCVIFAKKIIKMVPSLKIMYCGICTFYIYLFIPQVLSIMETNYPLLLRSNQVSGRRRLDPHKIAAPTL